MAIVKNVGSKVRMVADRYLHPGEAVTVTDAQARLYTGIDGLVVDGLMPVVETQVEPVVKNVERTKRKRGGKK